MFAITGRQMVQPSFRDGFARSPGESVAPDLFPQHAWVPAFGVQGGMLFDVAGGLNGVVGAANSWDKGGLTVTGETCYVTRDSRIEPANVFTVVAYAKIPASPTDGAILFGKQNTTWGGFYQSYAARAYTTGSLIRFGLGTSSSYYGLNVSAEYGKKAVIIQRYNGVLHDAFVNNYYNSVAATGTVQYADVPLYIGDGVSFGATWTDVIYSVYLYAKWLNNSQIAQLSIDPLLPFRRRKPVFYSIPAASGFKPGWYRKPTLIGGGLV